MSIEIQETLIVGYFSKAVKIVDTKKGRRYYQNCRGRFFPISKKKFENIDQTEIEIFQELPGLGWTKIN